VENLTYGYYYYRSYYVAYLMTPYKDDILPFYLRLSKYSLSLYNELVPRRLKMTSRCWRPELVPLHLGDCVERWTNLELGRAGAVFSARRKAGSRYPGRQGACKAAPPVCSHLSTAQLVLNSYSFLARWSCPDLQAWLGHQQQVLQLQ
jgi:hypothetical protein